MNIDLDLNCKTISNIIKIKFNTMYKYRRVCPRGVMAKAMDCGIVVSEFLLLAPNYVHFRANILGERYEHLSSRRIVLALNNLQR